MTTRRGRTRCLGVVLALGLAGCGGGGRTATTSAPAAAHEVASLTTTFVDTTHPTAANGDAPASPTRTLVTTVFYPSDAPGRAFPLVVFAHGFTGSPAAYMSLERAWAAAGYVVAAPAFPLTNGAAPGGPTQNDVVNQPADLTAVISGILRMSAADGPLHQAVDAAHVGVAGHSAGAATVFGAALDTCCRDDRISAVAILSGGAIAFPGGVFPAPDPTPVLFVHGDADDTIPISSGLVTFAKALPPRFFVTLKGSDHTSAFTEPPHPPVSDVVVRTTTDFFDRYLKADAAGLTRLKRDGAVPGVATITAIEK